MASARKENATHPASRGKGKRELKERESKRGKKKKKILANNIPKIYEMWAKNKLKKRKLTA